MTTSTNKTFFEYLSQKNKIYDFKIRFAGDPAGDTAAEKLKIALEKYDPKSVSKVTKTPIQESPLHFPQLQNMEVYTYDVSLQYPVTAHILQKYLSETLIIPLSNVAVNVPDEPFEELYTENTEETYEPLITKEDYETDGDAEAQKLVGEDRVMELLKELEKSRKDREDMEWKD